MTRLGLTSILLLSGLGCRSEPMTLREQAEQAQEELEDARLRAAEVIARSEDEAVEIIADAHQEAEQTVREAQQEADAMVRNAKEDLDEALARLGTVRPARGPEPRGPEPRGPEPRGPEPPFVRSADPVDGTADSTPVTGDPIIREP